MAFEAFENAFFAEPMKIWNYSPCHAILKRESMKIKFDILHDEYQMRKFVLNLMHYNILGTN